MILYCTDTYGVYTHCVEVSAFSPLPAGSVFVEPPATTGAQVAQWIGEWVVLDEYPQPAQPSTEELQAEVRAKRNQLLSSSDWTQVIDAPVDQAAWATYRQALRDISAQAGFPATVVWPTQPE